MSGNIDIFRNVLKLEAESLNLSAQKISQKQIDQLIIIYEKLSSTGGSLIFCGVGKSGHVAMKLASTFSSIGLPSFFLHPVEALHGDLGRVNENDAIVLISKSGTTEEIEKLRPFIKVKKEMTIGLLGNTTATLSEICDLIFDCSVEKEACINNQAPTTSSTLAMGMGDAMAVLFEQFAGLSKEGFALNHPGGLLGKSLSYKINNLMASITECPTVSKESTLKDVIVEMTKFPIGGCVVLEDNNKILGLIVEGDIRRAFSNDNTHVDMSVLDIMTKSPIKINENLLALDAIKLMENREKGLNILPVVSSQEKFVGILTLHHLLKAGFSFEN